MARATESKEIPTNSYVVLGLLSFREMSGYELKGFADNSIRFFFWSPAKSQIYSELRRLTSLGYVNERKVRQETRPDKRLYKITAKGREALRQWMSRSQVEPDILKSPLLLNLFLGEQIPVESLISQVEEYKKGIKDNLTGFEAIEEQIQDNDSFFYPLLTLKAGIVSVKARLGWADEVLRILRRRQSQNRAVHQDGAPQADNGKSTTSSRDN